MTQTVAYTLFQTLPFLRDAEVQVPNYVLTVVGGKPLFCHVIFYLFFACVLVCHEERIVKSCYKTKIQKGRMAVKEGNLA